MAILTSSLLHLSTPLTELLVSGACAEDTIEDVAGHEA